MNLYKKNVLQNHDTTLASDNPLRSRHNLFDN